jgi:hypothetical protein
LRWRRAACKSRSRRRPPDEGWDGPIAGAAGSGHWPGVASIADELSKVGVAQDFMASYREHPSRGNLSEVN